MRTIQFFAFFILAFFLFSCATKKQENLYNPYKYGVEKLLYNNPDLLTDLDVGFKSVPMPMDFDGDGDMDLLVAASGSYVEVGVFYFENISGNVDNPVFRAGEEVYPERYPIGNDWASVVASEVNGTVHILTPDFTKSKLTIFEDVPQHVFWKRMDMPISIKDYTGGSERSFWKIIDFDGDSVYDLVCATGGALLFIKNTGTDEKPVYGKPVTITTETGEPLGRGLNLEIPFADYDNDGDFDYIAVTSFSNIVYCENTGTSKKFKFAKMDTLKYKGRPIQFMSRAGGINKPRAVDFNNDGFVDIINGDEDGKISFMKNTGKVLNGVPEFLPPVFFQQEAKYVDLGALATPRVFDWDGDGLDDILSGNGVGNICFVKNLGGRVPSWDAPKLLEVGGIPIRIIPKEALPHTEDPHWGYTSIDVGDWDGDQLPDILVNDHNGNVRWLKNTGTRKEPKLAAPQSIEVEWQGKPLKPNWTPGTVKGKELLAPWRTSPFLMDFNKDGLMDLVMLDYEGYLATYFRFKDEQGKLLLSHPQRNFVYPDGTPIQLNQLKVSHGGRINISFTDWDGDGLEDLLFAQKPAVDWMKNLGVKNGKMTLQYMGRVVSRTLMGHHDGPTSPDWNKDGIPDLLVGTEIGVLYYWERPNINQTTTMTTVGKQKPANYKYLTR